MLGPTVARIEVTVQQIDTLATMELAKVKEAVGQRKRIDAASALESLAEILIHVGELRKELGMLRAELPIQ
jgi:hypothetical protein